MSKYDSTEIIEIADTIDRSFNELRDDAKNRYELYTLRRQPTLPEDLAREGQVNMLSPLIGYAAETVRADLMMNPTEFTCNALAREPGGGGIPAKDSKLADNLERSLAILWDRLDWGRRIDREVIWHQLVSPFAVIILECSELEYPSPVEDEAPQNYVGRIEKYQKERLLWNLVTPDPMTCSFLERNGDPTIFVRKYKQMAWEVQNMYSGRNQGKLRMDNKGNWRWVSDDYPVQEFRQGSSMMEEVEMVWLDDGETIYHLALNLGSQDGDGLVVWSGDNPVGRVSAFIVPGGLTPLRNPEDRFMPYLYPLMQTVEQINTIRTTRATASRNKSGPDNYIAMDPEIVKLYKAANEKLPTEHRWKRDSVPYLLGEIKERPVNVDPDFDKLETRIQEDLQKFLPSPYVHVMDPEIIKSATATSILHAAEANLRMYGPLMSAYDTVIQNIMSGILHSLQTVYKDEKVFLYATGDEVVRGKNLKRGEEKVLDDQAVNFSYQLQVKTRSMTQSQASAQYDNILKQWILPDGSKGPASFDDLVDAANYTDREAQKEKLAKESILNMISPALQQYALAQALAEIEYETGMQVPMPPSGVSAQGAQAGGPPPTPEQQGGGSPPAPSRLPNSGQRMDAPMIVGPSGGSSPGATGPLGQ